MATQLALRDGFIKKHPNLRYGLGEWRQYESGIWAPVSDLAVKNQVQDVIQASGTKLSNGLVTSIAELLKQRTNIPDTIFDYNPNTLIFNNSCLDLITYKEIAHSPENYATTKLNYDYDPSARSSAWEEALKRCPHVEFMQEFAGLCATPETKYELALWLYGPPGGGKSTFIVGLETMLGPKCCTLGLDELQKTSFGLSQIPGKTLAVSTEQPAYFVKCAATLNNLISGEFITINRKFRDSMRIAPRVKLLWAMNELPNVPSGSGAGLFRRVIPVYWEALSESDRNPDIKEEISHSGPAVMNWSLVGHKRLRERGRFNIPRELIAAREQYKAESDTTLTFVEECFDRIEDGEIPSADVYEIYQKWSIANGHKGALASNRFAAEMQRLGFTKYRKNIGVFWKGLDLKVDFPDLIVAEDIH